MQGSKGVKHICPSTPRVPGQGEAAFGDFVLMKKETEGEVENVSIVFEIKSTRYHINSFVIDSHGLVLVDNQYDVLLVFTLLPSRGSTKPASTEPKNMALHQVGEAMIAPTIRS
jgi:hypothetical protein